MVLTFSVALDAASARDVNNYHIVTVGGHGVGGKNAGHVTPVTAAVYDPSTFSVTLYPAQRLDLHNTYRLTISGTGSGHLKGTTGVPLAGANGVFGTDYVGTVTGKLLAGPTPVLQVKVRKRLPHAETREHNHGAKAAAARAVGSLNRATVWARLPQPVRRRLSPGGLTP